MKIAILLAHENSPHEGVVRPFINWAKGLSKNHDIWFILHRCGKKLTEFAGNIEGVQIKNSNTFSELIGHLGEIKPGAFFVDDSFQRLRLASKVEGRIKINTIVYVQILFATHSIMETFYTNLLPLREKLLFRGIKLASFSLLKGPYKKLLGNKHIIIANSRITATLLHILYGIEPDEIVYPPLDTDIFKPRNMIKKNQVLLYLGSHAGDTDQNFVIEICKVLRAKDFKILVIGNAILRERLRNKFEIYSVSGISDEELSNIYSESKLTICPQKWETFGYIPVESVACGTPVLTFNCMGLGETIINGKMGLLAKNKQEFLEILGSTLENKEIQIDRNFTREYIEENFSINASTERLEVIFRRMR